MLECDASCFVQLKSLNNMGDQIQTKIEEQLYTRIWIRFRSP